MADNYIWINGDFVPQRETDFADLTQPSPSSSRWVFEDMRCFATRRGPAVFRLEAHLAHFIEAIRARGFEAYYQVEHLRNTIHGTLCYNNLQEAVVRSAVHIDGFYPNNPDGAGPTLAIAAWYPEESRTAINETWRFEGGHVSRHGLDSSAALFVVSSGVVYTPPSTIFGNRVLRSSVETLAADLGYRVFETRLTHDQLYGSDEAFTCMAIGELEPVLEVEGHLIGDGKTGPITRELQRCLYDTTHGRGRRSSEWLDWVWGSFVGL